jgi:hypothetical protein
MSHYTCKSRLSGANIAELFMIRYMRYRLHKWYKSISLCNGSRLLLTLTVQVQNCKFLDRVQFSRNIHIFDLQSECGNVKLSLCPSTTARKQMYLHERYVELWEFLIPPIDVCAWSGASSGSFSPEGDAFITNGRVTREKWDVRSVRDHRL